MTTTPVNVRDRFFDAARLIGSDPGDAAAAWDNLASGHSVLLLASGKMAAGKDTVAPLVLDELGYTDTLHHYYADALKDEMDALITVMRTAGDASAAIRRMVSEFDMTVAQADRLTGLLYEETNTDLQVHARCRTTNMRAALQFLGTDVRRANDEDYWARIALRGVVTALAAGRSVFLTDARFPNEVRWAQDLGGFAVRLLVSETTQTSRLLDRDGLLPSPAAFTHASETALDDYVGFDMVLDNNGTVDAAISRIVAAYRGCPGVLAA